MNFRTCFHRAFKVCVTDWIVAMLGSIGAAIDCALGVLLVISGFIARLKAP